MLFTFPSRYLFTIGLPRVFSLAGWSRRIHAGFHVSRATQDDTYRRQRSRKGLSPAAAPLSNGLRSDAPLTCGGPTTPQGPEPLRFGLFPSRSPLLGESLLFSFPAGTKMFQFPALASPPKHGDSHLKVAGLSHSETAGSRVVCTSPAIIAAYHVLRRLPEPRHPPCALSYFPFSTFRMPHRQRAHTSSSRCLVSYLLRFVYCKV